MKRNLKEKADDTGRNPSLPTREARDLRRHLATLTSQVHEYLRQYDALMKSSSTLERGRGIAKLNNALEMANDIARHSGLDLDLKTGRKRRAPKKSR